MSRLDDAPDLDGEVEKPALRPFLGIHIGFPDPVYGFTGKGTIHFLGQDWTGFAGIASVDTISEGTDGSAGGVRATLNMIPAEFAEHLYDQSVRGVAYDLYVGALDETYGQVVGFKLVWRGTLQSYEIVDAGTTLTVTAGGESRMRDQRRPAIKRYSDAWQQRKYPGDKFFEYAPRLAEVPILWAKASQESL